MMQGLRSFECLNLRIRQSLTATKGILYLELWDHHQANYLNYSPSPSVNREAGFDYRLTCFENVQVGFTSLCHGDD